MSAAAQAPMSAFRPPSQQQQPIEDEEEDDPLEAFMTNLAQTEHKV